MHRPARTGLTVVAAAAVASLALTACSSSGSSNTATVSSPSATSTSTSTPTGSTAATPDKVIDVTLTGSKVSPAVSTQKVKKGDLVQITVTRDSPGEIHVHGYDLEQVAKPGVPVTFTFVADQQGVFEVEAHDPDLLLFQLQVA